MEAPDEVTAYAEWLSGCLSERQQREESLAKEISSLREAGAVGASALVELRSAVQPDDV